MNEAYYKRYIEKLIDNDPTAFVITREVTHNDGFGGETTERIELPEQKGRFYQGRMTSAVLADKGTIYSQAALKLLVADSVDIAEGDYIQHQGKRLKVAFLQSYFGICKQAELEVIA